METGNTLLVVTNDYTNKFLFLLRCSFAIMVTTVHGNGWIPQIPYSHTAGKCTHGTQGLKDLAHHVKQRARRSFLRT